MARFIHLEEGAVFHMGQGFSRRLISPEAGGGNITLNYSVFQDGQEFHFYEKYCILILISYTDQELALMPTSTLKIYLHLYTT